MKILILIILSIFLTGCEAVYTIEINGNDFIETLEINNRNVETWTIGNPSYKDLITRESQLNVPTDMRVSEVDDNELSQGVYQVSLIQLPNNLGLRYHYIFSGAEEYQHSSAVLAHFPSFLIKEEDGTLQISTGNNNVAFNVNPLLTRFTVRLIINQEVVSHNADEVRDGVYYWHFTRANYSGKEINVSILQENNENSNSLYPEETPNLWETDDEGYFGTNTLIAIYMILLLIGIIAGLFIYIKIKNSNT